MSLHRKGYFHDKLGMHNETEKCDHESQPSGAKGVHMTWCAKRMDLLVLQRRRRLSLNRTTRVYQGELHAL